MTATTGGVRLPIPLSRFRKYRESNLHAVRRGARTMFPDLRGFQFRDSENRWLESNAVQMRGARVGTVGSSGHRVRLNDELHHMILLPINGKLRVDRWKDEKVAGHDGLIGVALGERTTTVSENFIGIKIQLPISMLNERSALVDPDFHSEWHHDPSVIGAAKGAGRVLWQQVHWLVQELDASDTLISSDRLACAAIHFVTDLYLEFLAEFAYARSGDHPAATGSERLVAGAEEFMRAHLSEPLTIADVAAEFGISTRHLQASFRKYRSISPHGFLLARRLERVRVRLLSPHPGDTVTSIILGNGVSNTGRFAGLYRSAYGESPIATLTQSRFGEREN